MLKITQNTVTELLTLVYRETNLACGRRRASCDYGTKYDLETKRRERMPMSGTTLIADLLSSLVSNFTCTFRWYPLFTELTNVKIWPINDIHKMESEAFTCNLK